MKRAIYPLYAPADEGRALPILEALREKGVTVRGPQAKAGKEDALLLFLSGNVGAEGPLADAFFRLNVGRELVIPVDLDGCMPSPELQSALMARHTLDGAKYSVPELADRIARAIEVRQKNRLPLILSVAAAAILLLAGGVILWRNLTKAPATEATATSAPTFTPLPTPQMPVLEVDPEDVVEVVYVGDEFRYYAAEGGIDQGQRGWESVASGGWVNDGIHYYSKEDGHEYAHEAAVDLQWLTMLPNLRYLALCDISAELPDLSGLPHLDDLHLGYCRITSLDGLRGSAIRHIEYHGAEVEDFSPLTDCKALTSLHLDFVGSSRVDLSGLRLPRLIDLGMGSGYTVEGVDMSFLSQCPKLQDLSITGFPQFQDLSFLASAAKLQRLTLTNMDNLTSLRGLEGAPRLEKIQIENAEALQTLDGLQDHTSLTLCIVENCGRLRDISGLSGCKNLSAINIGGSVWREDLRDVSVLNELTLLSDIQLYGVNISDLDFLKTLKVKKSITLGITAPITDFSGLDAVNGYSAFRRVNISPTNGDFSPWADHLLGKHVDMLEIHDARDLDLSRLPRVEGTLCLQNCDIQDLTRISTNSFTVLELYHCHSLTSLAGLERLSNFGRSGTYYSRLEVVDCPRLTDWSVLYGKEIRWLRLDSLYTLPDFSRLQLYDIMLENMTWMEDVAFLSALDPGQPYRIELRNLPGVKDLSPLFGLSGEFLEVGPELESQARELVETGRFQACEVYYPEGGWQPDDSDLTLYSWEELDTLPKAVLKRVRDLTLAGDVLVNQETTDVWEDWSSDPPTVVLKDRSTGEETRLNKTGTTLTDLSRLSALTGLERLTLYYEPMASLEGVQALEDLQWLQVKFCPKLTDASAAFTVQELRRVILEQCPVSSLQGIQNLYSLEDLQICNTNVSSLAGIEGLDHLTTVRLSGTDVKDFSPLDQVDFTYAMEDRGGVWLSLNVDNGEHLAEDAFAFLANVPGIFCLEINDVPCRLWLDAVADRPVKKLWASSCGITDEELRAFAKTHPELEEIFLPWNSQLTDLTPLLELEVLQSVRLSHDMETAIASLGVGYRFALDIQ